MSDRSEKMPASDEGKLVATIRVSMQVTEDSYERIIKHYEVLPGETTHELFDRIQKINGNKTCMDDSITISVLYGAGTERQS